MALLALSHTPVEHQMYTVMLAEARATEKLSVAFSIQQLMTLIESRSYSTIRRGLAGLIAKMSIERLQSSGDLLPRCATYQVFSPEEVFARRRVAGLTPCLPEIQSKQEIRCNC